MTKGISKHPYIVTSILFLLILLAALALQWRTENFAYILLLYFIVTIGIKLDDISRQLGSAQENIPRALDDSQIIINQLNDITEALSALNTTLDKIGHISGKE